MIMNKPWRFMSFIIAVIIFTTSISVVTGNPLPGPRPKVEVGWVPPSDAPLAYIASEKLDITLSATDALIQGTFTFKSAAQWNFNRMPFDSAEVDLPIWLPDPKHAEGIVKTFWQRMGIKVATVITPKNQTVFDRAIGLQWRSGASALPVTNYSTIFPNRSFKRLPEYRQHDWGFLHDSLDPRFSCLMFTLDGYTNLFDGTTVLTVAYHQPLLESNGVAQFYYLPILANLPTEVKTTPANGYVINLKIQTNCQATVLVHGTNYTLLPGQTLPVKPAHLEAIRAAVAALDESQTTPSAK